MAETQSKNTINPKYIELMELLKQAHSVTTNKDKVIDRMRELLQQGEGRMMLKDLHPVFQKLGDFTSVIDAYYKEFQNAYGVDRLPICANEAHAILYKNIKFRKYEDSTLVTLYWKVEKVGELLKTIVKKMERINDLYSRKYEVTDEQRGQLQKAITDYLTNEGYTKVEVTMTNDILASTEISFTVTPVPDEDADFSFVYDDMIREEKFDRNDIQAWLYEQEEDESYKLDFDYGSIFDNIRRISQSILEGIREVELENFLNLIVCNTSFDLSDVAYRVETDFEGWLEYIDSKLTIEHVKSSKRLQQLLLGKEDVFEVYKGFPEHSYILEDVEWNDIAEVLIENQSAGTAKAIIQEFLTWSGEKSDFKVDQDNIQGKLAEYIRDRFDEVQEKILKDHELTQKIIPEENLFQVKDLWIFCS